MATWNMWGDRVVRRLESAPRGPGAQPEGCYVTVFRITESFSASCFVRRP